MVKDDRTFHLIRELTNDEIEAVSGGRILNYRPATIIAAAWGWVTRTFGNAAADEQGPSIGYGVRG